LNIIGKSSKNLPGIVTELREVHPMNGACPRIFNVSGISIDFKAVQFAKASSPIAVRLELKVTDTRFLQSAKALGPIIRTYSGMTRSVNLPSLISVLTHDNQKSQDESIN
jgi:hypothetical protein